MTDLALGLLGDVLIAAPLCLILNILTLCLSTYMYNTVHFNHKIETIVHVQATHPINDQKILDNEVSNDSFVLCGKHVGL